jgi:hypothetical protein
LFLLKGRAINEKAVLDNKEGGEKGFAGESQRI